LAARNLQPPTFGPLAAPRGLTEQLVARISADITGGRLAPGSKLPTEKEMMNTTGVSRTVVREAVACLRADRLVVVLHDCPIRSKILMAPPARFAFDAAPLCEVSPHYITGMTRLSFHYI